MNFKNKQVLLLTSTNMACNPRALKEVRLLSSMQATVTVVGFNLHNWTTENEKDLNKELQSVNFHYLESTKKDFFPWFIASLIEKIGVCLSFIVPFDIFVVSIAVSKRSWMLLRWIKKSKIKPDLVIAHNPAAFYPAYWLAKKYDIPFALDIEDFHPGETSGNTTKKSLDTLIKKIIPKTAYISFASPLIEQYTKALSGQVASSFVINNVFSKSEYVKPVSASEQNKKIRLIWFSQYIDYNRGLEKILPVLDLFADAFELVLIGNVRLSFFDKEIRNRRYISCKEPMSHAALQKELSMYDIGLAIEDGTIDLNRNICLTNKLWSYLQAGLYIIATDTKAQKIFMEEHAQHGVCASLSEEDLKSAFNVILRNKETIRAAKDNRFEAASIHNWEDESVVLIKQWALILA